MRNPFDQSLTLRKIFVPTDFKKAKVAIARKIDEVANNMDEIRCS